MKLNLKSDLKFHRFAICFFFQIETLTCTTSTTRYYLVKGLKDSKTSLGCLAKPSIRRRKIMDVRHRCGRGSKNIRLQSVVSYVHMYKYAAAPSTGRGTMMEREREAWRRDGDDVDNRTGDDDD